MFKIFCLSFLSIFIISNVGAQNNYKEIALPELMTKVEHHEPNMVILDVRTAGEFNDTGSAYQQGNIGHIKGAINIPLQEFRKDRGTVHRLDPYKDKEIYVICSHSYRSRVVSNMLLDSGFAHVNNTRGGMTEFYRRYNELQFFRKDYFENDVPYSNMAASQLQQKLSHKNNLMLISVANSQEHFWDSLILVFNKYFPSLKNALNFNYADSLQILSLVNKENRPVVLFNTVNNGAAELAKWLSEKGVKNVSYLVGGTALLCEYLLDQNLAKRDDSYLKRNSDINFITPAYYCNQLVAPGNAKIIDVRPDSMFNKVTNGAKYNYKHLKNAINYFAGEGTAKFEKQFSDKKANYILISDNGIDGIEFANALTKKGYQVSFLLGGLQRWEWYMNNVETFKCMDELVN